MWLRSFSTAGVHLALLPVIKGSFRDTELGTTSTETKPIPISTEVVYLPPNDSTAFILNCVVSFGVVLVVAGVVFILVRRSQQSKEKPHDHVNYR
jgi:hypothetical protein